MKRGMKYLVTPVLLALSLASSAPASATAGADEPALAAIGANDQPIHDAARVGDGAAVTKLLKTDPKLRDVRNDHGSTPLHLAATNHNSGALKALIAAGADVNARDRDGLTPLHMTAYTQNAGNAQLLLEAGADPFAKTNAGRDATSLARKTRSDEVAGVISLWVLKGCKAGKPC